MSKHLFATLACATILYSPAQAQTDLLAPQTNMTPIAAQASETGEELVEKARKEPSINSEKVRESIGNSMRDALATGIKTNPEYKGIKASLRATDEELTQGHALFRPSLDMSSDMGFEHTNDSGTRARDNEDEELFRTQTSLTLTQMLFDGYGSKYEVERQKARVTSSKHRVKETQELVGISIVEAYLNVLRQRYLLSISEENVNDHKDILAQIKSGVQAGRSTRADLDQARARIAAAEATYANVLESLEIAESEYYREVGAQPGALIMPSIPYSSLRPTVKDEVTYTLANSPTLNVFESDVEVAYAEAMGTRSTYYPQVDLQLSANYADHVAGVETYDKSANALVVMNWNLYRGGGDIAREREFRYRHEQSKASYAEAARNLEDEVRRTWSAMISAGTRAKKFSDQVTANADVVKAYKDQFTLSRRTLLDVLDAQNELYVSKTNKINAEFVQMFSVYRLLGLRGELLSAFGIAEPEFVRRADAVQVEWSEDQKLKAR